MKGFNLKSSIFLILTLGVIIRFIYILEIRKAPFFYTPFGDPDFFDKWALHIAHGDFIGKEVFFKAPLYPYVLAFFYKLMGHNLLIPRFLNILFDACSIFLLFLIGEKLCNRTVGLIAAFIASFSGILIYFSGEILGTSLAILLSLILLYLLLSVNNKMWRWLIAGFISSLLVIVRPNFLLCIPVIIIYIFFRRITMRLKIKSSLILLFGTVTMISITGIRNYVVGRDLVLINYSGGVNFYIGNNVSSDGVSAVLPGYGNDWDEYSIAEIEMKRELKPSEVSRFWLIKGLDFIRNHPVQFASLFIKKCYLLCNGKEISNNQNIYRYVKNSHLMRFLLFSYGTRKFYFAFPTSIIFSLGLSGILLTLRRRRKFLLPFLLIVSFGISVVLFFVSSRYRMPLFAFIIPFSSYSVYWFLEHLKEKRNIFIWIFSFIPFFILCNFDPYKISMEDNTIEYYNLGNAYLKKGELDKAKEYYERGIETNFHFPRLHLNLGVVYFKENNLKEAEKEYLTEIKLNPKEARAYHNLAVLYEKEGKVKDAIVYEKRTIEKMPRFVDPYVSIGRLYVKEEKYDSAVGFLEKANRLKKNNSKIVSLLGLVNLKLRRYDKSIIFYRNAIELVSDDAVLHYNLAVAYIAKGRFGEARKHLLRALSLKEDFAAAHYNLGLIYVKEENMEKAKEHFKEALRIQPDLLEAKKMIEKIE